VLARADRDDLTQFVAQAEIALAGKVSVKAAQGAISRGRKAGAAAGCDATNAQNVRDVLAAARKAPNMDEQPAVLSEPAPKPKPAPAPKPAPTPEPAPAKIAEPAPEPAPIVAAQPRPLPVVKKAAAIEKAKAIAAPVEKATPRRKPDEVRRASAKPRVEIVQKQVRVVKPLKPARTKVSVREKSKPSKGNGTAYAATAQIYYRELRCRSLSRGSINALYARVLREHRSAVAAQGPGAVRRMLRSAEARAQGQSCG
jgi:hypothetical protein